jgi:hypothetical protein
METDNNEFQDIFLNCYGKEEAKIRGAWEKCQQLVMDNSWKEATLYYAADGSLVGLENIIRLKMTVFWDVTLVKSGRDWPTFQRSISTRLHRAASQKTGIFILVAWEQEGLLAIQLIVHVYVEELRLCLWNAATNGPFIHLPDAVWVCRAMEKWYWQGKQNNS